MSDLNYYFAVLWASLNTVGPFVLAFLLALALPFFVILVNKPLDALPSDAKLTIIFACIVIGSALSVATSGRVVYSEEYLRYHSNIMATAADVTGNPWLSRLAHLVALTVSFSEIFSWLQKKVTMKLPQRNLWFAITFYFLSSVVVSSLFGEIRDYNANILYSPVVFTAAVVCLSREGDHTRLLSNLRIIFFIPCLASLAAMAIAPSLVLETGYKSLIPGFSIRLLGLTQHANSMGSLAAMALALELFFFLRGKANVLFAVTCLACLLLAQSKTAWLMTVVIGVIFLVQAIRTKTADKRYSQLGLGLTAMAFFVASVAILGLLLKTDAIVNFFLDDKTGLMTFTGRTKIWEVTLNELYANPLFGYGLALWDPLYRYQHGMLMVGQAHNQLFQILGQAGALGVFSMLVYLLMLTRSAFRASSSTQGLSLAFLVVLLMRCFSESPLRMVGILDVDTIVHLTTFAVAVGWATPLSKQSHAHGAQAPLTAN
jgi:O-antigen ligase